MTDVFQDVPSERRVKSKFFWRDLLEVQNVKRETISECKVDVNPRGGLCKKIKDIGLCALSYVVHSFDCYRL